MNSGHALMLIVVFMAYSRGFAFGQQCTPLKGSYADKCDTIGAYNQTFKLPYTMSEDGRDLMSHILSMTFETMENCSMAAMGELVVCTALYAPSCTEGQAKPKLPCRRVCSEFLKRCANASEIMMYYSGYLLSLCTLLPNNTGSSNECLEPPGFEKYYNSTTTGLLEGGCNKLIIPWCQNLDYTTTNLPEENQKILYKWYYSKNMTGNPVVDAQFDNTSFIHHLELTAQKIPKCARNYKKMICAESFPPCFPGEELSFYTLCSANCKEIETQCPEVKDSPDDHYWIPECQLMSIANGSSAHGFCKHTSWPDPHIWIHQLEEFFGVKPTEKPKTKVSGGIIAAAVLVPLIMIALIVAGVFLWRNRMLPWRYFGLKSDDRRELVT